MTLDPTKVGSNTLPKYQFRLISEIGDFICDEAPLQFAEFRLNLIRDFKYAGVFEEFEAPNNITFVGSTEKRALRSLHSQKGLVSVCSLQLWYRDADDQTYKQFWNDFVLDFDGYKEVTVSKTRNGVKLKTKGSGFLKKWKDRRKTDVDLTKTESIGGFSIAELFHWSPSIFPTSIAALSANLSAILFSNETTIPSMSDGDTLLVPIFSKPTDFEESQNVEAALNQTLDNTKAFFRDSIEERTLAVSLTLNIEVVSVTGAELISDYGLYRVSAGGTVLNLISNFGSVPNIVGDYELTYSDSIVLGVDESLLCYADQASAEPATTNIKITTSGSIVQNVISSPAVSRASIPILEAFERNLQLIMDSQFPLYTEFFGRLDVAYNLAGDMYLNEDQERFANIFNGLCFRGLELADINNQVAVNFEDLFMTAHAWWNIGMSNIIMDGLERIQIEERAAFFIDEEGMDLSSRINDIEIQVEALSELAYANIKSGFKKYDYEVLNGRAEYNTKNERTSVIPGKNVFNNIAPYRGDTMGASLALQQPVVPDAVNPSDGSTDQKSDNDIFLFKTQHDTGHLWNMETNENIQVLNNTSLFGDGSFNLFSTPTRNLLRHKPDFMCGLEHSLASVIRFQKSEKLQTLQTTDGADDITENQDLIVNDLGNPRYKPLQWVISLPFSEADIIALAAVKHKRITLSSTKTGWIIKGKYRIMDKKIDLFILPKFV